MKISVFTYKQKFLCIAMIMFYLTISCGGRGGSGNTQPSSQSIFITSPASTVAVGASLQFSATGSSQSGIDISSQVNWNSSSPAVASISSTGLITGLTVGTTTVTAVSGMNMSNSIVITVNSISSMTLSIPISSQITGTSQQLSAFSSLSDGSYQNISSQVKWTSSNPTVLSISASGLATALSAGTALVSTNYGSLTSSSMMVNVINGSVTVSKLVIAPGSPVVLTGSTKQLSAQSINSDGSISVIPVSSLTWSSGSTNIATVSATGLVTGVAAGLSAISGTYAGVTSSVYLTVKSANYNYIYKVTSNSAFPYYSINNGAFASLGTTGSSYTGANPFVWDNHLFGASASNNKIYYCVLNADGTLTSCADSGASGLTAIGALAFYGTSYAYTGSGSNVYRCPFTSYSNTTLALGGCTTAYSLYPGSTINTVNVNGDYLYVTLANTYYSVLVCPIDSSNGNISNCVATSSSYNVTDMAFLDNYAYIIGWSQGQIQSCFINPNGMLYPCINTGASISGQTNSAVIDFNKIYITSGNSNMLICPLTPSTGVVGTCSSTAVITNTGSVAIY